MVHYLRLVSDSGRELNYRLHHDADPDSVQTWLAEGVRAQAFVNVPIVMDGQVEITTLAVQPGRWAAWMVFHVAQPL
jgi:hypothetical protein